MNEKVEHKKGEIIEKANGKLPYHLSDLSMYKVVGWAKLQNANKEIPKEINKLKCMFESAWNELRNARSFVYDGIYKEEEIDFKELEKKVRTFHNELARQGYEMTLLKKDYLENLNGSNKKL